ncbi:MAG: hypothetical protein J5892_04180 [Bacilli bacterium]|nr:hypothetical protein [Bacilli bacterium]
MNNKIKQIHNENYIWYIYIFISIMAIISNIFEEHFVTSHNKKDYNYFHYINLGIFVISLIIYGYFVYLNYKAYLKNKKANNIYNLFASILFFIAGFIYVYTTFNDSFEEEIAI